MILPGAAGLTIDHVVRTRRRPLLAGSAGLTLAVGVCAVLYHSAPDTRPAPYARIVSPQSPVAVGASSLPDAPPTSSTLFAADATPDSAEPSAPALVVVRRTGATLSLPETDTASAGPRGAVDGVVAASLTGGLVDIDGEPNLVAAVTTASARNAIGIPVAAPARVERAATVLPVAEPAAERDAPVVARSLEATTVNAAPADAEAPRNEMRHAITHFVGDLRARASANFDLAEFYGEGVEHKVALRGEVPQGVASAAGTRVAIEVQVTKRDAVGRRFTRVLPVTMTVTQRNAGPQVSAVEFGPLRKP